MKTKNIAAKIGGAIVLLLLAVVARYAVSSGVASTTTVSENELYSIATKDCHKNIAATLGVEDNNPAVVDYCNCYGTTVASKYKGISKEELTQHQHEFGDIGRKCAADVNAKYQQEGE